MEDIEETLRREIEKSGLGVRELARLAGVDHRIIGRFISQERTITIPIAAKLCRALGLFLQKSK